MIYVIAAILPVDVAVTADVATTVQMVVDLTF